MRTSMRTRMTNCVYVLTVIIHSLGYIGQVILISADISFLHGLFRSRLYTYIECLGYRVDTTHTIRLLVEKLKRRVSRLDCPPGSWTSIGVAIAFVSEYRVEQYVFGTLMPQREISSQRYISGCVSSYPIGRVVDPASPKHHEQREYTGLSST